MHIVIRPALPLGGLLMSMAVLTAACSAAGDASEPTTAPRVVAEPATTVPVEVLETVPAETVVESTVPPAPVVAPLLVPVAPPLDENADEPVVELGSIEIPALGVSETLYEGIRLTTFDRGPGHWPGTAMPGEFGNVVVGGHRTEGSRPFRNIDDLVPDDRVIFTTLKGRTEYRVLSTEIVTPQDLRIVQQNAGFTATLFACHPVGSTDERIVVHLSMVTA